MSTINDKIKIIDIFKIPNLISLLRIPFAVLIILYSDNPIKYILLILAIFFDFLDGFLARKLNQTTKLGSILDPLCDRIFVIMLFIFFFFKMGLLWYSFSLFFLRDAITVPTATLCILLKKKIEVKARLLGKVVTILQFLVLVVMIFELYLPTMIGLHLILVFSIAAIVDYYLFFRRNRK
ncbi:MAG: CDP-alcohol phosphatidyltransferase family protein [Candidatus Woesearchaeota archaeon]